MRYLMWAGASCMAGILLIAACQAPARLNSQPEPATRYELIASDVDSTDCRTTSVAVDEALAVQCENIYDGTFRRLVVKRDGTRADYRISIPSRPSPTPTSRPTPFVIRTSTP